MRQVFSQGGLDVKRPARNLPVGSDERGVFTFEPRKRRPAADAREARDLPKEWGKKLVQILARDLHVGYLDTESNGKFFERMISRNERETTKYKRLFLGDHRIA